MPTALLLNRKRQHLEVISLCLHHSITAGFGTLIHAPETARKEGHSHVGVHPLATGGILVL